MQTIGAEGRACPCAASEVVVLAGRDLALHILQKADHLHHTCPVSITLCTTAAAALLLQRQHCNGTCSAHAPHVPPGSNSAGSAALARLQTGAAASPPPRAHLLERRPLAVVLAEARVQRERVRERRRGLEVRVAGVEFVVADVRVVRADRRLAAAARTRGLTMRDAADRASALAASDAPLADSMCCGG
jgi:hypothetical protein